MRLLRIKRLLHLEFTNWNQNRLLWSTIVGNLVVKCTRISLSHHWRTVFRPENKLYRKKDQLDSTLAELQSKNCGCLLYLPGIIGVTLWQVSIPGFAVSRLQRNIRVIIFGRIIFGVDTWVDLRGSCSWIGLRQFGIWVTLRQTCHLVRNLVVVVNSAGLIVLVNRIPFRGRVNTSCSFNKKN